MNITYQMTSDNITAENGEKITVYGINAITPDGRVIESVQDIFFDRVQAENFVNLCNSEQLDISHLFDVIENFIS